LISYKSYIFRNNLSKFMRHSNNSILTIKQWPKAERPRERALQFGPENLSDAELLAIFLRTGSPGKTAVDLARELLAHFGSLKKLLQADQTSFCQYKGLGAAKYIQLQAALEIARRQRKESLSRGQAMSDPNTVGQYLQNALRDYSNEVFAVLFLDSKHRVLSFDILFYGTIDSASIYPREIARKALENNAAAVIFAHNHPSGDSNPSSQDIELTETLCQIMSGIGIQVLDHCIIGNQNYCSLATLGKITAF